MMRSLYTATSGMKAQQRNIDTISNNLANVNTTSYKSKRMEFKDLMYETMKRSNLRDDIGRPVNIQVGHGVAISATGSNFRQGSTLKTENPLDLAVEGDGFLAVQLPNGNVRYTRDGSMKLSPNEGTQIMTTAEGYPLLDEGGTPITIESGMHSIDITENGQITAVNTDGEVVEIARIRRVKFMNMDGLLNQGQNLYNEGPASGAAEDLEEDDLSVRILQGHLESSNVEVVEEMVKMITAQRAYEINSKSITTTDEMMSQANNLKR